MMYELDDRHQIRLVARSRILFNISMDCLFNRPLNNKLNKNKLNECSIYVLYIFTIIFTSFRFPAQNLRCVTYDHPYSIMTIVFESSPGRIMKQPLTLPFFNYKFHTCGKDEKKKKSRILTLFDVKAMNECALKAIVSVRRHNENT